MTDKERHQVSSMSAPVFRVDAQLHDVLMQPGTRTVLIPSAEPQSLPEPVFPQHPDDDEMERSGLAYHLANGYRAIQRWVIPYLKARKHSGELRPILSYLFTEWKCNLDCHYCWAFDNRIKGMTEDTAKRAIDWLHSLGCRVIAIMGGEPLLRPNFIHKVVYYGAKRDFFVYLPTNGRLMRPDVIDRLGDAGVATINLAVDCVDEKPGLPKALNRIRPYFDHLVKVQHRYGYMIVFNINITRINMDDVKELTEIAYDNGISTDYHINETPMIEQSHFQHYDDNSTYLRPEDYPKIDALIDKHRQGYIMVNSKQHLADMKDFMRGKVRPWRCHRNDCRTAFLSRSRIAERAFHRTTSTGFSSPSTRTRQDGTGLGLSIAESIVNAHGGTIRVASQVGVGSTFAVTLPQTPAKGDHEAEDRQTAADPAGGGRSGRTAIAQTRPEDPRV